MVVLSRPPIGPARGAITRVDLMRQTPSGIPFTRTPTGNFAALADFPYEPKHLDIDGLKMAYVDEGPRDAHVILMVHGMPTWGYLYRHMIKEFLGAGFRCVVPDHIGFGRSDKVTDPDWYDIARHSANFRQLVESLALNDVTLVVQDWGGPIGLAQYATMPDRFSRLVIMNTWLHHTGYEYSPGILQWIAQNELGGLFRDNVPSKFNWGTLMAMSTQRVSPQESLLKMLTGEPTEFPPEAAVVRDAYDAPFEGLGEPGVTGPRRFPLCIPVRDPLSGNATEQESHFQSVIGTTLPTHFVWGVNDTVFTKEWGQKWHGMIHGSTWHEIPAGHFLQDTHGSQIATHILGHMR